jgi:hypothetical protein
MPGFCPESDWFAAYAERKLSDEDVVWLQRHVSRCDDCRRELVISCTLAEQESHEPVPADLENRAKEAVRGAAERTRGTRRVRNRTMERVRSLVFAAAVLAMCAGITYILINKLDQHNPDVDEVVQKDLPIDKTPKPETPEPEFADEPKIEWPPVLPDREEELADQPPKSGEFVPREPEEPFAPEKPVAKQPDTPDSKPDRETVAKTFAKVLKEHNSIMLTDPVGLLSIRRKDRKSAENVNGPTEVSEGDTLLASGPGGFTIEGKHVVVLDENTELSISRVDENHSSWLTVRRGSAIVNSGGESWWLHNGRRTLEVGETESLFSISSDEKALLLTSVDRKLYCRNENGEDFDVSPGESARLDESGRTKKPVPEESRREMLRKYRKSKPMERTLLHTSFAFDRKDRSPFIVRQGLHDRGKVRGKTNYFLRAVGPRRSKDIGVVLDFREQKFPLRTSLTFRFRYLTNAGEIVLRAPVTGKEAALEFRYPVDPEERGFWQVAEVTISEFNLVGEGNIRLHLMRDSYKSLEFHVRDTRSPQFYLDDVQICASER